MAVVGLDGCRRGWVAVRIGGRSRSIHFLTKSDTAIDELLSLDFRCAAIDMPIGLPERGYRDCDREARMLLGAHASRVFLGARRGVLTAQSQAKLNAALRRAGEPGVSAQLYGLKAKLGEVDAFVRAHPDIDLREAHPELVFQRLNKGEPLPRKRDAAGVGLRSALLQRDGFKDLDAWLTHRPRGSGAQPDDILDACAMAIAARDFSSTRVVPQGKVPRDATGLPMQIWY